jgi:hypothetical protein
MRSQLYYGRSGTARRHCLDHVFQFFLHYFIVPRGLFVTPLRPPRRLIILKLSPSLLAELFETHTLQEVGLLVGDILPRVTRRLVGAGQAGPAYSQAAAHRFLDHLAAANLRSHG